MAFAFASASLTEKSQFLRPITFGRIAFSAELLSISIRPSNKNAFNPCTRFNVYSAAFASAFFPKNGDSSTLKERYSFEMKFEKYDLVIIVELGYISFDKEGTKLLFTHLSLIAGRGATIITSNLSFDRW